MDKQTDLAARALGRLLAQFQGKPLLAGVVGAIAQQYQDLEDATWSIFEKRPFPVAVGDALTRWGEAVNEPREPSMDDATYRPLVQARVITNHSNGEAENVLALLRTLGASQVLYFEHLPATIQVDVLGDVVADDDALLDFLTAATGPVNLHTNQYTSHPFGFAADPDASGFEDGELGRSII